jgi:two-component system, NarL family, response regulator
MESKKTADEPSLKVCLVGGHPLATRYIQSVLSQHDEINLISCSDRIEELPSAKLLSRVFVIDEFLLFTSMRRCLIKLRILDPKARIIILLRDSRQSHIQRLLSLGVTACLRYDEVEKRLFVLLRRIRKREYANLRPNIHINSEQPQDSLVMVTEPRVGLSPRQERTLELLLKRMSNKEIGCALGISERTVKFHLANIYKKCGIHDRYLITELIRHDLPDSGCISEMPARNDGRGIINWSPARDNVSAKIPKSLLRSAR